MYTLPTQLFHLTSGRLVTVSYHFLNQSLVLCVSVFVHISLYARVYERHMSHREKEGRTHQFGLKLSVIHLYLKVGGLPC